MERERLTNIVKYLRRRTRALTVSGWRTGDCLTAALALQEYLGAGEVSYITNDEGEYCHYVLVVGDFALDGLAVDTVENFPRLLERESISYYDVNGLHEPVGLRVSDPWGVSYKGCATSAEAYSDILDLEEVWGAPHLGDGDVHCNIVAALTRRGL